MTTITNDLEVQTPKRTKYLWIYDLLLILVLLIGAFLRSNGLFWGEYQYLHPDERFLVWVGTDITPITSIDPITGDKSWITISEYFDTANSPLNPNNRGKEFYVYGTFPMFLTRFTAELIFNGPWSDQFTQIGFDEMTQVGRIYSAIADLSIVLLVYLVATKLYDKRIALLAAAFSAVVVLQIQQSHFFTMDTFVNFFSLLSLYFAVRIQTDPRAWDAKSETTDAIEGREDDVEASDSKDTQSKSRIINWVKNFLRHPLFLPSLGFGIAFGMALASKLNAAPVAFLLPAAVLLRILRSPKDKRLPHLLYSIWYLIFAGLISFVLFRILQPYAFSGPGFFGIKPNPEWLAQIRELRLQASINVDFPPAMQWARRPVWFSLQNLVIWGLGLPLGVLSWIGFVWAGGKILKGKWQKHALIWGWTAIYFVWQSLALNPTMRYQLPIYPTLVIFAAWDVFQLYDRGKQIVKDPQLKPIVAQLETYYDARTRREKEDEMPRLSPEVERFLREIDGRFRQS